IDMTKKIEFSAGGYGAESGDALSSVLKIDFKEGNEEELKGKVNLSMVDLGAIAEGPLNSASTFIIGVRRSYLTDMLKLAGAKGDFNISYYDMQGVFSYKLTSTNKLNLCLIYSADNFIKDPETRDNHYAYMNYIRSERIRVDKQQTYYGAADFNCSSMLASLSSVNLISPFISNRISVSLYNEKTYNNGIILRKDLYNFENRPDYLYRFNDSVAFLDDRFNKTFVFQCSFDFMPDKNNTVNTGFNYERISYDVNTLNSRLEYLISNLSAYPDISKLIYPVDPQYSRHIVLNAPVNKYSFYAQDSWQIQNDLVLNAGLRYDYFDMNKKQTVSPRISLSFIPIPNFSLKAAYGIFYQTPNYRQLKYDYPSESNTDNQKAVHYIIGADYRVSDILNLKLEGYIKKYENMIPVQLLGDGSLDYGSRENSANGYARGIDVQLVSDFEWINLRVSYGYMTAKERLNGTVNYYSRYTDQMHTLASILDLNLGRKWNASLRVFYGSGYAVPSTYLDRSVSPARWITIAAGTKHLPAYEREDIRISKEFEMYSRPLVLYLDVMNVLNKKNIVTTQYTYDRQGNPNANDVDLFPIIPSIGVMYNF
ncbi:MAG: TonB-dependent receptor plug domain-containing protein, partial [Syntrophothermus sp.]